MMPTHAGEGQHQPISNKKRFRIILLSVSIFSEILYSMGNGNEWNQAKSLTQCAPDDDVIEQLAYKLDRSLKERS